MTQIIGVTSVDCMPSADKTVHNRELEWLPLIVWVRELWETDLMWPPELSGGNQREAAGPAGLVRSMCKGSLAPTWRVHWKLSKLIHHGVWDP